MCDSDVGVFVGRRNGHDCFGSMSSIKAALHRQAEKQNLKKRSVISSVVRDEEWIHCRTAIRWLDSRKKSLQVWIVLYLSSVVRHLVQLPRPNEDLEDMEDRSEDDSPQIESGRSTPLVLRVPKRKNSVEPTRSVHVTPKKSVSSSPESFEMEKAKQIDEEEERERENEIRKRRSGVIIWLSL